MIGARSVSNANNLFRAKKEPINKIILEKPVFTESILKKKDDQMLMWNNLMTIYCMQLVHQALWNSIFIIIYKCKPLYDDNHALVVGL